MKKILKIIILLMCCMALVGCSSNRKENKDVEGMNQTQHTTKEDNTKNEKTPEEIFSEYKEKCIKETDKLSLDNEHLEVGLEKIENTYNKMLNLTTITEDKDLLSNFVVGISYLYVKFEEGTPEHNIGEKGFEAVKSLYIQDGMYIEKMQEFKEMYKEIGRLIFTEKHEAGQYKVGTDIEAGEYVFFTDSSRGYFCVSSDANGKDIIANENFSYNSIMTIRDGEYLELSKCYAVPIKEVDKLPIEKATMFKVGTHIMAGEYKLIPNDGRGYYCIYSDDRQDDIESNDNFNGQSYITVVDGQYLKLSRCHIEQ